MAAVEDFQVGDRVRHIGRDEEGHVHQNDRDGVRVHFDNPTPKGHLSVGIYDAAWFRIHPDLLVNISRHETLTERRRAGERLKQQTPGA